jgi:hypothetical protein
MRKKTLFQSCMWALSPENEREARPTVYLILKGTCCSCILFILFPFLIHPGNAARAHQQSGRVPTR